MHNALYLLFAAIAIATVLNLILKKLNISHIIGYIATGIIVTQIFGLSPQDEHLGLDLVAEFGIVFLMFSIGLEMSFHRMKAFKTLIFLNGTLQVTLSAVLIYLLSFWVFKLNNIASVLIALAFSLSSSAIVLPYLKQSKDVYTPYGERSTAILIFQDLAVIPILLLVQFLTNQQLDFTDVLLKTSVSAVAIILFMFTLGKKIVNGLLQFSSHARLEEIFLSAVLSIVVGAALLAHLLGFTYSLGAFIAGMIIAETHYHMKVESDIASYKDILLGTFFFSIGLKIDIIYAIKHLVPVFGVLLLILTIKAVVVYILIRKTANKSDSIKSALALCQIGEFSFAIFTVAVHEHLLGDELGSFIILVTVLSMVIAPFIVNNIYRIAALFVTEFYESDKITPIEAKNHIIICGFSIVGRIVADQLNAHGVNFVIISDNLQHVLLGRERGYMAYFGHLEKKMVMESLKVEESASIILTMNQTNIKSLISSAILEYYPKANLVVKVNTKKEQEQLSDLNINTFVHAQKEAANLLVKESLATTS